MFNKLFIQIRLNKVCKLIMREPLTGGPKELMYMYSKILHSKQLMYMYMYEYVYVDVYMQMYVCICMYIYIYTHIPMVIVFFTGAAARARRRFSTTSILHYTTVHYNRLHCSILYYNKLCHIVIQYNISCFVHRSCRQGEKTIFYHEYFIATLTSVA